MGTANRQATPEEIQKMQALVEQAMRDGAVGFSTGLIYIPGTYSNTEEVVALAKAAAKYGGVYASHMRDEGSKVLQAIEEAVTVGKRPACRSSFRISRSTTRAFGARARNRSRWSRSTGRRAWTSLSINILMSDRARISESHCQVGRWRMVRMPSGNASPTRLTRARIVDEMQTKLASIGQKDYSYATDRRLSGRPFV